MYRIMRNLWIDEIRARRARPQEGIEAVHEEIGDDEEAIAERNATFGFRAAGTGTPRTPEPSP